MHIRNRLPTLVLVLGMAACGKPALQQASAPPAVDSAAVKAGVADLWAKWSVAHTAGDIAALTDMVADSARIDLMGMPAIIGRAAWKSAAEIGYKTLKYTSMNIAPEMTIPVSNALAYQTGGYTEGSIAGKKKAMAYGRYSGMLRKDPDGKWRIAYIMVFADSTRTTK